MHAGAGVSLFSPQSVETGKLTVEAVNAELLKMFSAKIDLSKY